MLVITGTQRSGTSVIAAALIESGYDLGSRWYDEEAQGGYEHETICAFYRDYLGDPTFPFDDFEYSPRLKNTFARMLTPERRFGILDLEVVKFSYLLMNPVFVMLWHKFRPKGDTFLVMQRETRDVVDSKLRLWSRFKHDSELLRQSPSYLADNFLKSVCFLVDFGYKYGSLVFPSCLDNLPLVNKLLAHLDPNVQIAEEAWAKTVDKTQVHFK